LIRDYLREEVAVREAQALGLDEDDVVIRRRLRRGGTHAVDLAQEVGCHRFLLRP
jgi:hypothetical protein